VVASFSLMGGVLTGKYDAGGSGRATGQIDETARAVGRRVRMLADETGETPSALAIAFALSNPAVATVLFGATKPAQIEENVTALDIDPDVVERVSAIGR
jgi:L-glyceraldehyde 3-phosphate reductase